MIVLIRETADGETVRGYLPLFQHRSGVWYAITTVPLATADQAVDHCAADLGVQIRALAADCASVRERILRYGHGIDRLEDRPGVGDRVIVHGRECVIAPDGSITLPGTLPVPGESGEPDDIESAGQDDNGQDDNGQDDNGWMPTFPEGIEIDDDLIDVLRRVSGEDGMSRGRVLDLIATVIEDEPMELLLAVSDVAPEHVSRIGELVVTVLQARGERSLWARGREARRIARKLPPDSTDGSPGR